MDREMTRVEDMMTTALVTVFEDDALDVANIEMEIGKLRHLPVVSREHPAQLVGLVTHRDVLRAAGRAFVERGPSRERMLKQVPIGEVMRHRVETARPEEPAVDAARRLLARKIGCLPVVDEEGALVGIVTEADFVRVAADLLEATADQTD